jgi:hypothetical protein
MWRMTDRHARHEIGLRCDVLDLLQRKRYLGHPKVADDDPIDRLHGYFDLRRRTVQRKKNYNKVSSSNIKKLASTQGKDVCGCG